MRALKNTLRIVAAFGYAGAFGCLVAIVGMTVLCAALQLGR